MPKLNADGTPTGEYGARVFKKTIYDPDVISDDEFIKRGLEAANDAISKGNGFGEEYGACTLPDDLDEFDKANGEELDGVEFGLYSGEEIVIDFQTFYHYLKIICDKYLKTNFEQTNIVNTFLMDYTNKFLLKSL